jgi:hypothetical protein
MEGYVQSARVTYVSERRRSRMPSKKNPNARKRLQRVSIRAERHPEPDWDRLAWALIQYARVKAAAEQAKPDQPDESEAP